MTRLSAIEQGLKEMATALCSDDNGLTSTVTFLSSSIQSMRGEYWAWRGGQQKPSGPADSQEPVGEPSSIRRGEMMGLPAEAREEVAEFAEKVEQLVESALLAVQKLVKSREEEERKRAAEKGGKSAGGNREEEEEEEEVCDLKQNHLTILTERLQKHVSFLHAEQASVVGFLV